MVIRRVFDNEKHVYFVTFSCYKRRTFLQQDQAKRIVIGQPRYYGFNIWSRQKLEEKLNYMHLNLVSRRTGRTSPGVSLEFGPVVSRRQISRIADPMASGIRNGG